MDVPRTRTELLGLKALRGLSEATQEDLVAEVIALVQAKFSNLPDEEASRVAFQALTWLTWRERRRQWSEQRRLQRYADEQASGTDQNDLSDAEAEVARLELRRVLHEVIAASLTPQEQIVVLRRFVQEVPVSRVATELGASEQHVYYLSRRALHVLRERMAGFEGLYG